MQINFQQLRAVMKSSGIPVYRDEAPSNATYPYIIYEFVNERPKRASSKVWKTMPLYQIAVISDGTETAYKPLTDVLDVQGIVYSNFVAIPYDENDSRITQYITNVRCVNG